jgi:hypothetical protein
MTTDGPVPACAHTSATIPPLDLRSCFDLCIQHHQLSSFNIPCRHLVSLPFVLAASNTKRSSASHRLLASTTQALPLAQSASMVLFCGVATRKTCRRVFIGLLATSNRHHRRQPCLLAAAAARTITIKITTPTRTPIRSR